MGLTMQTQTPAFLNAKDPTTEMFTRQIRQNLKSAAVKLPMPPVFFLIFKSVIPTGDLALFSRHARTFVGKFARITDPKFRGI